MLNQIVVASNDPGYSTNIWRKVDCLYYGNWLVTSQLIKDLNFLLHWWHSGRIFHLGCCWLCWHNTCGGGWCWWCSGDHDGETGVGGEDMVLVVMVAMMLVLVWGGTGLVFGVGCADGNSVDHCLMLWWWSRYWDWEQLHKTRERGYRWDVTYSGFTLLTRMVEAQRLDIKPEQEWPLCSVVWAVTQYWHRHRAATTTRGYRTHLWIKHTTINIQSNFLYHITLRTQKAYDMSYGQNIYASFIWHRNRRLRYSLHGGSSRGKGGRLAAFQWQARVLRLDWAGWRACCQIPPPPPLWELPHRQCQREVAGYSHKETWLPAVC